MTFWNVARKAWTVNLSTDTGSSLIKPNLTVFFLQFSPLVWQYGQLTVWEFGSNWGAIYHIARKVLQIQQTATMSLSNFDPLQARAQFN